MARDRKRDETEHLKGVIRELKAELKHLKKELGRSNKVATKLINTSPFIQEDEIDDSRYLIENKPMCVKCAKPVVEVDLGVKVLHLCKNSACGHKKSLTKIKIKG